MHEFELTDKVESAIIATMSLVTKVRDIETGNHIYRTCFYVKELAQYISTKNSIYALALTKNNINMICKAASLHDIGKIGIPDAILRKIDKLSDEEWKIMKMHTVYGANMIEQLQDISSTPKMFLNVARNIAFYHHEKWDGTGYPEKLSEVAIPLPARIMSIVDVYDALISVRVYKQAMTHEDAIAWIYNNRKIHFDPDLVDIVIMRNVQKRFQEIFRNFSDDGFKVIDQEFVRKIFSIHN
jgi:putative two-component system response regulator